MLERVNLRTIYLSIFITIGVLANDSAATTVWDEAIQGDLSGDRLAPTAFVLSLGANSLLGSVVAGDLDYVTIKLLPGRELVGLVLQSYSGADFTSFIAIQSGTTFTAAPPFPPISSLLGYTHFGPGAPFYSQVGQDLMYALSHSSGAIGFGAPLPSGDYSFWIQQTGEKSSYQFDFIATPEPAAVQLVGCGIVGLLFVSARPRHRVKRERRSHYGSSGPRNR